MKKVNDKEIVAAEQDAETKQVIARIIEIQGHTQWDLPITRGKALTGKSLDDWLSKKEDAAAVSRVERGLGYALKKRELGHGAFQAWVKETGRSPRSVQECIRIAQMLIQLSHENAQRATHLKQRQLSVLSSAPAKMVNDLFDTGALDNADTLDREQLKEIIQLQKRCANLEANLETAEARLHAQRRNTKQLWPASVVHCRMESSVLSDQAIAAVHAMRTEMQTLLTAGDLANSKGERAVQMRAAIGPLYTNLMGVAAELHTMIRQVQANFEDMLPTQSTDVPTLTIDECEVHASHRDMMLQTMANDAITRRSARAARGDVKRGRGRPEATKKTKSKKR